MNDQRFRDLAEAIASALHRSGLAPGREQDASRSGEAECIRVRVGGCCDAGEEKSEEPRVVCICPGGKESKT